MGRSFVALFKKLVVGGIKICILILMKILYQDCQGSRGRYYVDLITSMIPQGSEGRFVSSERHDIEPIRFFIVNAEKLITGSVNLLGEEKIEISFTSYNKKDITSINVSLLNPSTIYYENTDFKQMQVNIRFHNGLRSL